MLSYIIGLCIALFCFACLSLFNTYRLFKFKKHHNTIYEDTMKKMNTNKQIIKKNQTDINLNTTDIQSVFEDIQGYDEKLNNFEEILTTATQNVTGNAKMDQQFQTDINTLNDWKTQVTPVLNKNKIKVNDIENEIDSYNKKYITVSEETIDHISSIEDEMDDLNVKLEKLQNELISINYGGS